MGDYRQRELRGSLLASPGGNLRLASTRQTYRKLPHLHVTDARGLLGGGVETLRCKVAYLKGWPALLVASIQREGPLERASLVATRVHSGWFFLFAPQAAFMIDAVHVSLCRARVAGGQHRRLPSFLQILCSCAAPLMEQSLSRDPCTAGMRSRVK